eukprot:XP_001696019.1 predicted protein [Chlamydomonas reinhardtii]
MEDESALVKKLAGLPETDPEFACVLNDLAVLRLGQGKTAEAQKMLEKASERKSVDRRVGAGGLGSIEASIGETREDNGDDGDGDGGSEPAAAAVNAAKMAAAASAAAAVGLGGLGGGECRHVVEVHGLTTETRTHHLEEFVGVDGRPQPLVKWVDDNHALIVCSDQATAMLLLQDEQELFQLRPFTEASAGAKAMAVSELLPPRERPKTTAAVARLMLSHALGMRDLRDRGAERDLAAQRKAAREARRERETKVAAAWDDD